MPVVTSQPSTTVLGVTITRDDVLRAMERGLMRNIAPFKANRLSQDVKNRTASLSGVITVISRGIFRIRRES